jgi:hypothetical protein
MPYMIDIPTKPLERYAFPFEMGVPFNVPFEIRFRRHLIWVKEDRVFKEVIVNCGYDSLVSVLNRTLKNEPGQ